MIPPSLFFFSWGRQRRAAPRHRVARHQDHTRAIFPMCFTPEALEELKLTVGVRPPETGAKGFSPKDLMGFDVIEFDEEGSKAAGGAVYSPDVAWGMERCQFHMNQPDDFMRLWSGDIHSHPGGYGSPSGRSGKGLGDLGYVEEVFDQNEWMQFFAIPILTLTGTDEVEIHPWICRRESPLKLFIADLEVCPAEQFPARKYNPEWEDRIAAAAKGEETRPQSDAEESFPVTASENLSKETPEAGKGLEEAEALQTRLSGMQVKPAASNGDLELRLLVSTPALQIQLLLPPGFPKQAPRVLIATGRGMQELHPVPWARYSRHDADRRLAELCTWIAEGFHELF